MNAAESTAGQIVRLSTRLYQKPCQHVTDRHTTGPRTDSDTECASGVTGELGRGVV